MTKFTKAILLAAALIFAPLSAAQADNDIGCGLGTEIFKGQTGPVQKIVASTTNGMFGFQSISITFGLLNCGSWNDTITANAQTRHFAAANIDALARDAAMGRGESLDTLAALLEVEDTVAFGEFAQTNYDALFPTATVTSEELLVSLDRLMAADERFAAAAPSAQL
ncbi:MAG: DUF3015 domain-containing protein [bacterium]|nr:DUF3015 domain-containing protein [bacterium]